MNSWQVPWETLGTADEVRSSLVRNGYENVNLFACAAAHVSWLSKRLRKQSFNCAFLRGVS